MSSTRSSSTQGCCRACSSRPTSRAPLPDGIPVAAGAGDQAAGARRRRGRSARAALDSDRNVWRRLRRARRLSGRRGGSRPRVLSRRSRRLARDGRHALRRGLACLAARSRGARRPVRRARRRGRALAPWVGRSAVPALPDRRADTARRSRRARGIRRARAAGTTAGPWCGQCSKGWPTGCATRSS